MTTAELIKKLQEIDPEGTTPVCVGNEEIYTAAREPAYWDGRLERHIIDESKRPYYCIVGGKIVSSGKKVELYPMGIDAILENDPDAPIDITDCGSEESAKDWGARIERRRAQVKKIKKEVEEELSELRKDEV